jgi:ABC-2 type transport system ATP-binding protein
MIHTEQLTRHFGDFTAVADLSLDIGRGEVFSLLGPNGAGKTTTVRMLACLIAPSAGRAFVAGYEVGRDSPKIRRRVGLLTEVPGLYDRFTVWRNLEFFAEMYGVSAGTRSAQVRKYLELLGLWERRHEAAARLSKGLRQKLAIARALVHEPEVLFLDEPTASLDPEAAKRVRDFIVELRRDHRTIFVCTHNLDEADRVSDKIGILRQRLLRVDTPERLRRHSAGRIVQVRLREHNHKVSAAVRELAFVDGVEEDDDSLLITVDDPNEHNPELLRTILHAGGEVRWVTERRPSLEEIYLKAMRGPA